MSDKEPKIYLLPTMMTAGNVLCGFYAILQIFDGRYGNGNSYYYHAILAILAACVFDALDGRVARMGGQESAFGMQLDSLADIISFGLAPALLINDIVLSSLERTYGIGKLIASAYLVCGAMRLARFNCLALMDVKSSSTHFRGCPIPAAAGVIASITLLIIWMEGNNTALGNWKYSLAGLMCLLSYLMISDLEYPSFKSVSLKTSKSMVWVLIAILVIVIAVKHWQKAPAVVFVSYLLYGLFRPWISNRWRREIEIEADATEE
jgi:CDP-diacylglycerol---serine O-phosphatidyltransferase